MTKCIHPDETTKHTETTLKGSRRKETADTKYITTGVKQVLPERVQTGQYLSSIVSVLMLLCSDKLRTFINIKVYKKRLKLNESFAFVL